MCDQPAVDLPDLQVPTFGNADFVGTEFASEVATRYFRTLMSAEVDYRCARADLNRNRFGPMDFSLKEVLRNLTIKIYQHPKRIYKSKGVAITALSDSLDGLLMLKDHQDLTTTICLDERLQYGKDLFHVLETIRPMFYKLGNTDMKFKVLG